MKEQFTVVTRKGQITVPVEIRRALGLKVGDRVAVSIDSNGQPLHANLRPAASVTEMTFGSIKPRKTPEDFAELREFYMESATERDERTKRQ